MVMCNLACLGWGSLVWDQSRPFAIEGEWREDGPLLPIEFARLSGGGRLTLVLCPGARSVQTLWARMPHADLDEAVFALRMREGAEGRPTPERNIARLSEAMSGEFSQVIGDWARAQGLDDVIWTALPPRWDGQPGRVPVLDEVMLYLASLAADMKASAEEYIRRAPASIRTPYREAIEREFGWLPETDKTVFGDYGESTSPPPRGGA
jgi:hypothetical protein